MLVTAAVGAASLLAVPSAFAMQWTESGDARDNIAQAQAPYGPSGFTLEVIEGKLRTLSDSSTPLDADIYKICITAPATFSAHTQTNPMNIAGTPVADTQLFLFNDGGSGIEANDDSLGTLRSQLPAANLHSPTSAGTYFLAISGYDRDPVSGAGEIFPDAPFTNVFGPTGPGGGQALSGWNGGSGVGTYRITLTGAKVC
jgi:hypothetical protein